MKIIRILFGIVLFTAALAFVVIEGRLLFSGDWLLHEMPVIAFLQYAVRLALAIGAGFAAFCFQRRGVDKEYKA